MKHAVAAIVLAACGGRASTGPRMPELPPPVPIVVEWKLEQGQGNQVDVALVVDGVKYALGALDAATLDEPGTPNTCALRAANSRRTELVCGDGNSYMAQLGDGELVVSLVAGDTKNEVKRVPVQGTDLSVKLLLLPGSKI